MYEAMTLFTTASIGRDEYESILKQVDGVLAPENETITRDTRFVWFSLDIGDQLNTILAEEEERQDEIVNLLGDQPRAAIVMIFNNERGSKNIAIDFALLFAQHYPCVLSTHYGEVWLPKDFAMCAEPGYDGYRWEGTIYNVIKGSPETPEEKSQRLKQAREDKVFGGKAFSRGAHFEVFTTAKISLEEFARLMHEIGAGMHSHQPFIADLLHHELGIRLDLLEGENFQRWSEGLPGQIALAEVNMLNEPIQSHLTVQANSFRPSINLALDFMLAFCKRYPCIVRDGSGELHTPEELLEFAQPGYLGYDWNADHTQVVKGQPEPPIEPRT